jgi:hypothetical protein
VRTPVYRDLTTPFTGTDTAVRVVLSEEGGDIRVTATVTLGIADLRAVYLDIGNDALLDGMSASGEFVTSYQFDAKRDQPRHGSNLHGGGTPCPCDIGVELGTPGSARTTFSTTRSCSIRACRSASPTSRISCGRPRHERRARPR